MGPVDVLVTGAAGFIGGALVRRLLADGLTVQGTDIAAGPQPTVHLDVTDGAEVFDVMNRLRPRTVIHCAAIVDDRTRSDVCQQVNVGGTEHVVQAATAINVERFVHVSSIAALGLDPGADADETSPLVFDTGAPYFDTKAASEALVRECHERGALPLVVVRPGDVYGARSEPWVLRPLAMMKRRMPVLIQGGAGRMAHCWIDNLVDGIVLALQHPDAIGGIFQLHDGDPDTTTYRRYFEGLAKAGGVPAPRASLPRPLALAMGGAFEGWTRVSGRPVPFTRAAVRYLMRQSTYSTRASREVLGWTPQVTLDEAFDRLASQLAAG